MSKNQASLPPLGFEHVRTDAQGTFETALGIALAAHAGQTDKRGVEYIKHPLRVALAVDHLGPEHSIVAVLHDVIEDSAVQLASLYAFGPAVLAALDAITKRNGEEYSEYLQRVAANPIAKAVKLADLADNMDPRRRYPGVKYALRLSKYRMAVVMLECAA